MVAEEKPGADWQRARLHPDAIPVAERLPPPDQEVLAWLSDPSVYIYFFPTVARCRSASEWWGGLPGNWINLSASRWEITHWLPLASASAVASR